MIEAPVTQQNPTLTHIPQRVLIDAEDNVRWLRQQAGAFAQYSQWYGSAEAALCHIDEALSVARIRCEHGKLMHFREMCSQHGLPVPVGLQLTLDDFPGMGDLLKALHEAGRVEWEDAPGYRE